MNLFLKNKLKKKKKEKKIFAIDIDNTICVTHNSDYKNSKPIKSIIKVVNKLKKRGHIVKLFTSRYMNKCNGNIKIINKKYRNITCKQLRSWGLNFDELIMGKPVYDFIIDDKTLFIKDLKKFI
jgi:capsule biosynthesis phosphatase